MDLKQATPGETLRKAVVLMVFILLPAMTLTAQEKPVAISDRNITIRQAIKEIENQTGYVVGFKSRNFDASKRATLPRTRGTAKEILGYLLSGSGQTWEINGDYIVITPDPRPKPVETKAEPAPAPPKPEVVQGSVIPAETMRFAFTPETEPVPAPKGGYSTARRLTETPRWAVKSNLLVDATLTISLGTEFRTGRKTTIDVPFTHNSWGRINGRQWENFSVQPGVRFWTCEAFNGFFWGFHAHYGKYNIENMPSPPFSESMRDYRYEGQLVGAGVNAGFQWILGKRWALEAELGVGYAYLWYDKYNCATCGRRVSSETKNYFGPTKAALSLVFMIK